MLWVKAAALLDYLYRHIFGTPLLRFSKIDERLYLGGQVFRRGAYRLKKWGITSIVSMRESLPKTFVKALGFSVLHLPTKDQHAPRVEDIERGVKFIDEEIKKGGVYIHCWHGEGRGPTMAVAYFIYKGMSFEQAMAKVKKARLFVKPTPPQQELLHLLEKKWAEE